MANRLAGAVAGRIPDFIEMNQVGVGYRFGSARGTFGAMKPEAILSHRTLFLVLIGLFEMLLVISMLTLWSLDPRRLSPIEDVAGITWGFASLSLFVLWWLLRRGEPRLASICLLSALAGIICAMILPPVP